MRNIDAGLAAEFATASLSPMLLAELYFDSGTLRLWSGIGNLSWNGNDYIGGGNLIGLSQIEETQDTEAKGLVASLNGIPSDTIALSLQEKTRGRKFRLYLGTFQVTGYIALEDDSGDVATESGGRVLLENALGGEPYRIFSGLMDVMEFTDDGKEASIRLSIENALIIGQRAKLARYTAEDQKKRFPNDKGLDFINQLQDKEVVW